MIVLVYFVVVVSFGLDFVVVVCYSVVYGCCIVIYISVGIGFVILLYVVYFLVGLSVVIVIMFWLFIMFSYLVVVYLVYLVIGVLCSGLLKDEKVDVFVVES